MQLYLFLINVFYLYVKYSLYIAECSITINLLFSLNSSGAVGIYGIRVRVTWALAQYVCTFNIGLY